MNPISPNGRWIASEDAEVGEPTYFLDPVEDDLNTAVADITPMGFDENDIPIFVCHDRTTWLELGTYTNLQIAMDTMEALFPKPTATTTKGSAQ